VFESGARRRAELALHCVRRVYEARTMLYFRDGRCVERHGWLCFSKLSARTKSRSVRLELASVRLLLLYAVRFDLVPISVHPYILVVGAAA